MTPTETVKDAYAAFKRGDIATILNMVADDVEWIDPGAPGIPYAGTYQGRKGVEEFFSKLAATAEYPVFEPRQYVTEGDNVVALGYAEARSKATGRSGSSSWAMSFVIRGGKIARFEAYHDTVALSSIFQQSSALGASIPR